MIQFPDFEFATAPRTGSTWFLDAAGRFGISSLPGQSSFAKHTPPPDALSTSLRVTIVRHPFSWLCSYYGALMGGHIGVPAVDQFAVVANETLGVEEFIRAVIDRGLSIEGMFDSYPADTVMRLEDMPWAAFEFLVSVGGKIPDWNKAKADHPPINQRKTIKPVKHRQALIDAVVAHEKSFCERFEYYAGVPAVS